MREYIRREIRRLAWCLVPRSPDEVIAVFARDEARRLRAFERLRRRHPQGHLMPPYTRPR